MAILNLCKLTTFAYLDCSIVLICCSGWVWESVPTHKVSVAILSRSNHILTGLISDGPSIGGTMTRMPLVQCPCDNARRLRRPHHIGVCFPNTRTSRHCQAHCSRSGPFQEWPRQPVSLPFSLLCQSMCLVTSVVYGHRHTILTCECSSRAVW